MRVAPTLVLLLLSVSLMFDPSTATAEGARTPVWQPNTIISTPGHYYLTRDVLSTNGAAVTINSDEVLLDLNGYTVSGDGDPAIEIATTGPARRGIRIRNGRIRNSLVGVNAIGNVGRRLHLSELEMSNFDDQAIQIQIGLEVVVDGCTIETAGDAGILISDSRSARIESNSIRSTFDGIVVASRAARIVDNVLDSAASATSGTAISVTSAPGTSASIVRGNTVASQGSGLRLAGRNILVEQNAIWSEQSALALASESTRVVDNSISSTVPDVILVVTGGAIGGTFERNAFSFGWISCTTSTSSGDLLFKDNFNRPSTDLSCDFHIGAFTDVSGNY